MSKQVQLNPEAIQRYCNEMSDETRIAILSMLVGYISHTLSGDVAWFAADTAKILAEKAGVSREEFERVAAEVKALQVQTKASHPLGSMMP
jgi:hypothetical protein